MASLQSAMAFAPGGSCTGVKAAEVCPDPVLVQRSAFQVEKSPCLSDQILPASALPRPTQRATRIRFSRGSLRPGGRPPGHMWKPPRA